MFAGKGLQGLAIVIITLVSIGGIVGFVLAYNYYPRKNVNIQYDGRCYELVGDAYESYKQLIEKLQLESLRLRLDAIEDSNALVRIAISGTTDEVYDLARNVQVIDVRAFGSIDKVLMEGLIQKSELERVVNLKPEIISNLAVLPSEHITEAESESIATHLAVITDQGIEQVMLKNSGVRKAECR